MSFKVIAVKCENCMYFAAGVGSHFYAEPHRRGGVCRLQPRGEAADPLSFCAQFNPCEPTTPDRLVWPRREAVD